MARLSLKALQPESNWRKQLQHFVQLSFLTGPSLSFRCLPSIPFQPFPPLLLKSGCFLCYTGTYHLPGSWGWDTLGERKTYPRELLYTTTPPHEDSSNYRIVTSKELERIPRGSEALELRARDVPTSVVSEGRAAFFNTISSPTSAPIFFF